MTEDLLLTYYGDDFTGSTDVMEVLTWAGLPTVLFVDPPDAARLARFDGVRAIGVAGESRSRSPEWMSSNLPRILERLRDLGAPLCQYKVCSTFDSSPTLGSIGRALEIGLAVFQTEWAPIVVGAPNLDRYQAFGNLFATAGGETYRVDRHPTMRRHPVTPMDEADLRLHLSRQTDLPVGLVDLLALQQGRGAERLAEVVAAGARGIFCDVIDDASLLAVGKVVWENRDGCRFSVASSGLEYALTAYWRATDLITEPFKPTGASEADRLAVISGSCSPETEASIRRALADGFFGVRVDPREAAQGRTEQALSAALKAAGEGRSIILYTALGPDDESLITSDTAFQAELGARLADLARDVLQQSGIRRAIICGGDTSSRVGRRLDAYAFTAIAPMAIGSPLCRLWSDGPMDGLEIVMKGGQRGGPDFFEQVRRGRLA